MKRQIIFVLGVGVLILIVAFVLIHKGGETVQNEAVVPSVTVADAVNHSFHQVIESVSTLKAEDVALVSPKRAGTIEGVLVEIGDRVRRGQALARLDQTDYRISVNQASAALATADAGVGQAEAAFLNAQQEYNRAVRLIEENVISRSRYDAAEAAFKSAQAALEAAREQRRQASAGASAASESLSNTLITAPIEGVVVARNAEVGQSAAPGSILFRIVNTPSVKASLDLPERDLSLLERGETAVIQVDAFPDQSFTGTITAINPMIDPSTRTFRVEVTVPNPEGALLDGMFARVKINGPSRDGLGIPRSALLRLSGSGTDYVFVLRDDNTVEKRIVLAGLINDEAVEISGGLSLGERVVTSGAGRLQTGKPVIVSEDAGGR